MSCPKCIEGFILPGEPTGSISKDFQGAYFSPAPSGSSDTRAIVLLTDAFGLPMKNCMIMADALARQVGCDVWVPDIFNGRPLVPIDNLVFPDRAGVKMTVWDWLRFVVALIPRIPALIASRPSVVDQRLRSFIALLKDKKPYQKIGAVGYCFGGAAAIRLGGTNLVQSVLIAHPGMFTLNEAKAIKCPSSWVCAEDDITFGPRLRLQVEATFAARKGSDEIFAYEFHDYKGTAHGFAARPNLELPIIKDAYENALDQTIQWFKRTLLD